MSGFRWYGNFLVSTAAGGAGGSDFARRQMGEMWTVTDILLNESNASRRGVPVMCFQSNGTSACTNESGRTFTFAMGGVFYGSGGSLSAVSGIDGAYMANFADSKVSIMGPGMVLYSSNTALPWATPFRVVPFDSYDSMRLGLFALPNAAAEAAGGLITRGTSAGQLNVSAGSIGLLAATHSGVTIQGLSNYANISSVTLNVGTHSGATVQGVTRINSNVTLNADTHSGATIAGIVAGGIIASTLASGVLTSAKFAAGAVDAAALATDAGQEIADRVLSRNVAGGSEGVRSVSEALYPLRNKILIQGSVGTVFQTDDATSAWTFTPSLGTAPLSGIDPTT